MKFAKTLSALFALGAVTGLSVAASSPGLARSSFDGSWQIEVVGAPGKCSDRFAVAVNVSGGRVAYSGMLAGKVTNDGSIRIAISDVRASGALLDRTGTGHWRSASCTGSWTARKA